MAILLGNDVSKWQGTIDWDTYKKNSNFVILKATEGNGFTDPTFLHNQAEARRVGIQLGYYHFARPDLGNSPEVEAEYFLKTINVKDGELLCLDYEPASNPGDAVVWCKKWLDYVAGKLNGYKCLIYLNQSQTQGFNWQSVVDAGYGLWIAAYTYDPNNNNFQIGKWPFAAMQQWSNKQQVPGIPAAADANVFFGDLTVFKKYCYHVPAPTPTPPAPTPTPPSQPIYEVSVTVKDHKEAVQGNTVTSELTLGVVGKKDGQQVYAQDQKISVSFDVPVNPNPDSGKLDQIRAIIKGKGWPWQKCATIKKLLGI